MKTAAQKKGDNLEDAIEFIEKLVLDEKKEAYVSYRILRKQKFYDGMHEIDIVVITNKHNGEKNVFLFECKNRDSKPVDKNDVIILDHKIKDYRKEIYNDAVNVKGIIVGKSFSSYAITKAKEIDVDIELVTAKDVLDPLFTAPGVKIQHEPIIDYALIAYLESEPDVYIDLTQNPIVFDSATNTKIDLAKQALRIFEPHVNKFADEFVFCIAKNAQETKHYEKSSNLDAKLSKPLLCKDMLVDTIKIDVSMKIWVSIGELEYAFDVEGKRKVMRKSLEIIPGKNIPVDFISQPGLPWNSKG